MATAVKVLSNFTVDRAFTMDTVKEIRIIDHIPNNMGIASDDAEPIYNMIVRSFNAGQHVVLDFEGVELVTTAFLDVLIGDLYENYTSDQLNETLEFRHLSPSMEGRIEGVVYSAKLYFADPEGYTKMVEDVLNDIYVSIR
ncbi:MAG: STAS-like domain-containing protein [Bacteroidales bacterium]|nr:STAS-like domain-containing protein [Bacteroidales bacterium]